MIVIYVFLTMGSQHKMKNIKYLPIPQFAPPHPEHKTFNIFQSYGTLNSFLFMEGHVIFWVQIFSKYDSLGAWNIFENIVS